MRSLNLMRDVFQDESSKPVTLQDLHLDHDQAQSAEDVAEVEDEMRHFEETHPAPANETDNSDDEGAFRWQSGRATRVLSSSEISKHGRDSVGTLKLIQHVDTSGQQQAPLLLSSDWC